LSVRTLRSGEQTLAGHCGRRVAVWFTLWSSSGPSNVVSSTSTQLQSIKHICVNNKTAAAS